MDIVIAAGTIDLTASLKAVCAPSAYVLIASASIEHSDANSFDEMTETTTAVRSPVTPRDAGSNPLLPKPERSMNEHSETMAAIMGLIRLSPLSLFPALI